MNTVMANIIGGIAASLVSSLIIGIISYTVLFRTGVKICKEIAHGRTADGRRVFKFKLVNRLKFITARSFHVTVFGIKRIRNTYENSVHEERSQIDVISRQERLATYISERKLKRKKIRNPDYIPKFFLVFSTGEDLLGLKNRFCCFMLQVRYIDSFNRTHIVEEYLDYIKPGEFSGDGNDYITPYPKEDDTITPSLREIEQRQGEIRGKR
jgi:DNA-binding transcriptional MerR regulator